MDAITQWFNNNTPYKEGVVLYGSLPSHNKILLKNFQKKESGVHLDKLKYELQKVLNSVQESAKSPQPEISGKQQPKLYETEVLYKNGQNLSNFEKNKIVQHIAQSEIETKTKQALYFHQLPTELQPVLLKANTLFKEMCLLKVQLNEVPVHAEKKALTIQIDISKKQKENELCWQKIDFWLEHKTAPKMQTSDFSELSPANLLKKEQHLFAAISKLKKRKLQNEIDVKKTSSVQEINKLKRSISKQENNLLIKNEELITIKRLINGN